MFAFTSKQKQVEAQLDEYRRQVELCISEMNRTLREYCETHDRECLQENVRLVHKAEGRADDIRREIEVVMYSKALFPESRGDVLGLLETMDKMPNQAEAVVLMVKTHHLVIPDFLQPGILQLGEVCENCVGFLLKATELLFTEFSRATELVGAVDRLESEADDIEMTLIDQVFDSELEGTRKILLRDLIKDIASVSDRAESAADRIRIIVAKRGL